MSETTATGHDVQEQSTVSWRVREATGADVPAVAMGVSELLVELGGMPPERSAIEVAVHAVIDDGSLGVVLVAESERDGEVVGVLGVSWQVAIRVPGRYGLVQELWVKPQFRGMTIGGDMLLAFFELARKQGVERLEVGLPSERYPHLGATEAFYTNNGFQTIGTRMRKQLP